MVKSNGILSNNYEKLTVIDNNGKEIVTITCEEVTLASGCAVKLKPSQNVSTKDLTEELAKREGVQEILVEPYKEVEIKVNGEVQKLDIGNTGPCRILVIYD